MMWRRGLAILAGIGIAVLLALTPPRSAVEWFANVVLGLAGGYLIGRNGMAVWLDLRDRLALRLRWWRTRRNGRKGLGWGVKSGGVVADVTPPDSIVVKLTLGTMPCAMCNGTGLNTSEYQRGTPWECQRCAGTGTVAKP